jgi:CheY-like chemotaxis protein
MGERLRVEEQCSVLVVDGHFIHASKGGPKKPPGNVEPFVVTGKIKQSGTPKRVLVVEDNLDSVHTLAFLLTDMGHTVEYAINGYVALDVARRFRPDIVLLDLGLPGIDGFEVCRRIKRDSQLRLARVIALTAFSQDEYRERAAQVGCELYLVKPVETKVLEELLG